MSGKAMPTASELVSVLKRSYLPTLLIEGTDDVYIYRYLKGKLQQNLVSLQPCGGRNVIFEIHDRKAEFSNKNVVFIADKDAFRYDGIPDERKDIIFTEGYCIENDIYQGSTIHSFIDDEDRERLELLREIILRWYAFELEKYKESTEEKKSLRVSAHVNVISPPGTESICSAFAEAIGYWEPSVETLELLSYEYNLNIRGKQLFQMLARFLSKRGRFSFFSEKNLIEVALKQEKNLLLDDFVAKIDRQLNAA